MDISFYQMNGSSETVEVSENFYEWLAKSSFSKIDKSKEIEIIIEGDKVKLPLVQLNLENRNRYIHFLLEEIAEESNNLIIKIEKKIYEQERHILKASAPSDSIEIPIYRIKKLKELKTFFQDERFVYLEYI